MWGPQHQLHQATKIDQGHTKQHVGTVPRIFTISSGTSKHLVKEKKVTRIKFPLS